MHLSSRDPFDRLLAIAASERVDMAAEARANQRWLRTQADEEATFAGVLLDLAEQGRAQQGRAQQGRAQQGRAQQGGTVAFRLFDGRHGQGAVRVVGRDVVAIESEYRFELVRLDAIVSVKAAPGERLPTGDRVVSGRLDFAVALAELATDRPDVVLQPFRGDPISGELRSVGADIARVRTTSPPGEVAVQLATIAVVGVVGVVG